MSAPTLHGAAAELALATLFVEPRPERLARLRTAAAALAGAGSVAAWRAAVPVLELHGVLPLAARNLALAGLQAPAEVEAELRGRLAALAEDARRARTTLRRFLGAANAAGVEPVLLKGSSLALDAYPEPGLRAQADIDLLVRPAELAAAVRAGAEVGLVPADRQLPDWWYRLTHFHLKLHPALALLCEVELHWRLQAPALLLTPDLDALRGRATRVARGEAWAWNPDPLDRFVHLATHLASHAGGLGGVEPRALLLAVLGSPSPALRLKWVLDVLVEVERLHASHAAAELAERVAEWGAERDVRGALLLVRDGLGTGPAQAGWIAEVLSRLPPSTVAEEAPATRATSAERRAPDFDFRWSELRRLPAWAFPPRAFFQRRRGRGAGVGIRRAPLGLERALHAAGVAARALLALVAFPAALLHRAWLVPGRRAARRRALEPARVLELVGASRRDASG